MNTRALQHVIRVYLHVDRVPTVRPARNPFPA